MAEPRLTRRATADLHELPAAVRSAVVATLEAIGRDPESCGKRLVGRMFGVWSARVGSYRVLYTIEHEGVIVRAIRHRAVVYRSRRRRR